MKPIKQSVINTFKRIGIPSEQLNNTVKNCTSNNWLTGESCPTTELIAHCIGWVYATQLKFEQGISNVNISDFDRIRYFVLEQDDNAYMTCLD